MLSTGKHFEIWTIKTSTTVPNCSKCVRISWSVQPWIEDVKYESLRGQNKKSHILLTSEGSFPTYILPCLTFTVARLICIWGKWYISFIKPIGLKRQLHRQILIYKIVTYKPPAFESLVRLCKGSMEASDLVIVIVYKLYDSLSILHYSVLNFDNYVLVFYYFAHLLKDHKSEALKASCCLRWNSN